MPEHNITVLQTGDTTKANPYTIAIANNPAYKLNGRFKRDPVRNNRAAFEQSVEYIYACLFGNLPQQAERFLSDPLIFAKIRVVSLWTSGLAANDENALIEVGRSIFIARQAVFKDFFARFDINPDVAFAVTSYSPRKKASAFRMIDDQTGGGEAFEYDGKQYSHLYYHEQPGAIAVHTSDRSMTALHEFGHAASSYPNGYIADLYNNSKDEETLIANKKFGAEIPREFCTYNGSIYLSNPNRHEEADNTYHAELLDPRFPALMDDYRFPSNGVAEQCQHDKLTRQFLLDRIKSKTKR